MMFKLILRFSAWISAGLAGLILAGCVTSSSVVSKLISEGDARHVPILIYDTYWNNPYQWSTRHAGDPLPRDFLYIEFVNAGEQPISSIELYVQQCSARGAVSLGGWLRFTGVFLPGQGYKANPSNPSIPRGTSLSEFSSISRPEHLIIRSIKVCNALGNTHEYNDDVSPLLSKNISNFCATRAW